ncbi:MAG: HNH endonuclease [Bacilli bacterium]|nr:HNH endonuclease [Bacilli bacterium]
MTIEKLLNGIGIKIFMEYFEDFSNDSLQTSDLIEILPNEYTEKSRRSRTSKARKIIKNHELLNDTLHYIINSNKIDDNIKNKAKKILNSEKLEIIYPDDIEDKDLFEGTKKQITVNAYERNLQARQECINKYGYKCVICDFDFEKIYGDIGQNFIHVHHLKPLSEIDKKYKINPIEDLRPVCPNCHAMLHKQKPAYSIEEIKKLINKKNL